MVQKTGITYTKMANIIVTKKRKHDVIHSWIQKKSTF